MKKTRSQADIVLLHRFAKAAQRNLVRVKFPWLLLKVNYSSGQRGQTVNLMAMPSLVRIQH